MSARASARSTKPCFREAARAPRLAVLVVTDLGELPFRDVRSSILRAVMGSENHHPIEYQLFYVDLRRDAQRRAARVTAAR